MNTAKPSKNGILFNAVLLSVCVFMFFKGILAIFGIIPGDVPSLVVLIVPILLGAGFFSRLWLAWRGKQVPLPLLAMISIAAGGMGFLLWRLSEQPFARYDMVYLLLLPLPFAMTGVLRFNQRPSQSGGDDSVSAP